MVMVRKRYAQSGPLQQDAVSGEAVRQDATSAGRKWRTKGVTTTAISTGGTVLANLNGVVVDMLPGLVYEVECQAPIKNLGSTAASANLRVEASGDGGSTWATLVESGGLVNVEASAEVTRLAYGDVRIGSAINRLRVVALGENWLNIYGANCKLSVEEHGAEP